jgi:hypothetical protein
MVSLDILARDQTGLMAERMSAFTEIERHRAAGEVVRYNNRLARKGKPKATEDGVLRTGRRRKGSRIAALIRKYYGGKKGRARHWSGMGNLRAAIDGQGICSNVSRNLYYSEYAKLSWYAHGSLAGVHGLSKDSFERLFGLAHDLAAHCALESGVFYAEIIGLTKLEEFPPMVERARGIAGKALAAEIMKAYHKLNP